MNPQELILGVYSGQYNVYNLPVGLYTQTANRLTSGVSQGFGSFALDSPAHELSKKLHLNIYNFSSAKTFQEVRSLQSKIVDSNGVIRNFNDFKKDAELITKQYNEVWLKTEYNTAINQGFSASRWTEIQENKDIFPYLRYQTIGDERVRDEHMELDNIVKSVDDPFWETFMPPNGWSCRCLVIEEESMTKADIEKTERKESELSDMRKNNMKEYNKQYPALFRENPGKTGRVFKKTHPYYTVPEKYSELKERNFDLPIPEELKT